MVLPGASTTGAVMLMNGGGEPWNCLREALSCPSISCPLQGLCWFSTPVGEKPVIRDILWLNLDDGWTCRKSRFEFRLSVGVMVEGLRAQRNRNPLLKGGGWSSHGGSSEEDASLVGAGPSSLGSQS